MIICIPAASSWYRCRKRKTGKSSAYLCRASAGRRHELRNYKFFAFDGVAKALFIATDRGNLSTETKFVFFDIDFNHLDFTNGHKVVLKV